MAVAQKAKTRKLTVHSSSMHVLCVVDVMDG